VTTPNHLRRQLRKLRDSLPSPPSPEEHRQFWAAWDERRAAAKAMPDGCEKHEALVRLVHESNRAPLPPE
jgi:hypothetical protein